MRICFTTALFGDAKTLDMPGVFEKNSNYDYFLFTDVDEGLLDTSWDIININNNSNIINLNSNVRRSRYPKFMSWELLESLNKHYDVVFYCDAYWHPVGGRNFEKFVRGINSESNFQFIQSQHQTLSIREGGVTEEMEFILKCNRDSKDSIEKTKSFFKKYDPGIDLNFPQYFENTVFGYYFEDDRVREITREFWKIYTEEDITYRDQPLWNFLLLKYNLQPVIRNELTGLVGGGRKHRLFKKDESLKGTMRGDYTQGVY